MSFSNYAETASLNWLLDPLSSPTRPSAIYIALYTAAPSDAGGGTEVSGGSYARTAGSFTVSGDTASNTANIEFPTATASWGTVTHMAIYDASTGGNMLAWSALTSSKTVDTNDLLRFSAGQLTVTLD